MSTVAEQAQIFVPTKKESVPVEREKQLTSEDFTGTFGELRDRLSDERIEFGILCHTEDMFLQIWAGINASDLEDSKKYLPPRDFQTVKKFMNEGYNLALYKLAEPPNNIGKNIFESNNLYKDPRNPETAVKAVIFSWQKPTEQ